MLRHSFFVACAAFVTACAQGSTSQEGDCYAHYSTPDSPLPEDDEDDAGSNSDAAESDSVITAGDCLLRKSTVKLDDGGTVEVYVIVNCGRKENPYKL